VHQTCIVLLHYDSSKRCVCPYKFIYFINVVQFLNTLYSLRDTGKHVLLQCNYVFPVKCRELVISTRAALTFHEASITPLMKSDSYIQHGTSFKLNTPYSGSRSTSSIKLQVRQHFRRQLRNKRQQNHKLLILLVLVLPVVCKLAICLLAMVNRSDPPPRGLYFLRPPPSLRFIFKNLNFTTVMA
jgi:hypothetical protein